MQRQFDAFTFVVKYHDFIIKIAICIAEFVFLFIDFFQ
jgi:hypothetical protein